MTTNNVIVTINNQTVTANMATIAALLNMAVETSMPSTAEPAKAKAAKTHGETIAHEKAKIGLITSQNVTAPKLVLERHHAPPCLITSQNVTAPKQKKMWHQFSIEKDYASTFRALLESYSRDGVVTGQHGAHPQGKEIQVASWFSQLGHDIEFIKASGEKGIHTPDFRIDGEIWEIKRLVTHNRTKLKSRLGEGANQSENLIVDLSENTGDIAELTKASIEMLDDKRVRKVMVISGGKATVYEK